MVGSLDDQPQERQFRFLNKWEPCIKIIHSAIERFVSVRELLVSDIALFEPGGIVPRDGVFISDHKVQCDGSGATGESGSVKKANSNECVTLGDQANREGAGHRVFDAANALADYFFVSGSKVPGGYGEYAVAIVGQESFDGHTMTGAFFDNPLPISGCRSFCSFGSSLGRPRSYVVAGAK